VNFLRSIARNEGLGGVALLRRDVFWSRPNSQDAPQVGHLSREPGVLAGLAVTGPDRRYDADHRGALVAERARIALTTGVPPISFVLLLVLFTGQTVLYPWSRRPSLPNGMANLRLLAADLRVRGRAVAVCLRLRSALLGRDPRKTGASRRGGTDRVILLMLGW